MTTRLAGAVAAALLISSCGSSGQSPATSTSAPAAAPSSTATTCITSGTGQAWPGIAPAGLPVPAGLKITAVQTDPVKVVRFTTAADFHASVAFWIEQLPQAGFTLGVGDSESEEADIPFSNASQRASLKINDGGPCLTNGVLSIS